jgi:hypothetical protein
MSKELNQLFSYIEENTEGYFLKGSLKNLEELLNQLFSIPEPLDLESQEKLFILSMSCYPLFSYLLDRDLNTIPGLLRYSLLSKCFFVDAPEGITSLVSELLDKVDEEWNEIDEVGDHQFFNVVEMVLRNPSLDLKILEEEFNNTGDTGFISAILNNPNCPQEILQSIVESDHFIFDDRENEDLIEQAKEILASRKSNTK